MKIKIVALAAILAMSAMPVLASPTVISTINGYYGQYDYDDAELTISNTTNFDFTNVQLGLTGYQGLNNGKSQVVNIGTVGANSTSLINWSGPLVAGDLFADDYDDEYPNDNNPANAACTVNDTQYGESQYFWCDTVGNFYVTMTAQWNGQSIYSQFSPGDDPLGIGNACGNTLACFVGWEGLDPNGLAETVYDDHSSGGPNGVLANIYAGTPPNIGSPTPEPSSLILLGTGLAGLAGAARRRLVRS